MDEDLLARLKSSVELLAATIEAQITNNSALIDSTKDRLKTEEDERKATNAAAAEAARRRRVEKAQHDAQQEDHKRTREAVGKANDSLKKFYNEVLKISDAGIQFAGTIGTTATKGVQLELKNRAAVATQLFRLDLDRVVSAEQIKSAQQSLAQSFVSTREGMQLSATGARQFAQNLKGGFKSEFELTGQSLRALVTAGLATEKQFDSFRKASGRAGLTSDQFATIVNKNSLSFMLYGQRFAKAAVEAERMGISLASVQAAQESMVTNLDGTIDTIAQINQLGGQIDFGTLTRINEFQGPEATLKYLQATIPPALFQSASTRALLKGFGVPIEDLMKSANSAQASAADQIEQSMTESERATGVLTKALGFLGSVTSRVTMILNGSFLGLALAAGYAAKQLFNVKGDIKGALSEMIGPKAAMGARILGAGAGIAGVGMSAYQAYQAKKEGQSILPSVISGALSGAMAGFSMGGPYGALIGAVLGGGGTAIAGMARGGLVRGPGTATSDSILTPLSDGEFVINANATKAIGLDVLTALNSGARVGYGRYSGGAAKALNVADTSLDTADILTADTPQLARFLSTLKTFNRTDMLQALQRLGTGVKNLQAVNTFGQGVVMATRGIPLAGSLLGGAIEGAQEYNETGSIANAIFKGLFSTVGAIGGTAAGMMTGNPFVAALSGVAGGKLGEAAYDTLFNATNTNRQVATQANTDVGLTSTIKDLISTINDSTTSVDMNGQIQQVPRMRLAGVRSRYEVG
jgi:hypothetical protein